MSLPSAAEIVGLVTTCAPGVVILGVRQSFIAAPAQKLEERVFAYAVASILYYAAFNLISAIIAKAFAVWLANLLEYWIIPFAIGTALGFAEQNDFFQTLFDRISLRPIHLVPTAWDYKFSRLQTEAFVLVTLTDGSQVAGLYGRGSFSSSNSEERDLLICEMYDSDTSPWSPLVPRREILLCGRDIRFVEFL